MLSNLPLLNHSLIDEILSKRFASYDIDSLKSLPNPYELKDMHLAVERILQAINNNQNILIVGDYDVDGVISRVILKEFFEYIYANKQTINNISDNYDCLKQISYITPDRFKDGYGISIELIKDVIKKVDVIITVDNGINANNVATFCKDNNVDLIVTDHHQSLGEMPDAYCVINPKHSTCTFPFKDICGAQIAWYLIAGIKSKIECKFDMSSLLDLLIMAIIADVMPLVSINRALVSKGLKVFNNSNRPCIVAIKEVLKKQQDFSAQDIAFGVAPKINVAGRVKNASLAIEFLSQNDTNLAIEQFEFLNNLIIQRKELEQIIINKCGNQIKIDENIALAYDESFHSGVIGISASKIAEKYKKVALIGYLDASTNIIKMSGRSYGGVDLYKLVSCAKEFLHSFGGHTQAIGLSVKYENISKFKEALESSFKKYDFKYIHSQNILGILDIDDVNLELLNLLDKYEPYGQGNEACKFLIKDIRVFNIKRVGKVGDCLAFSTKNTSGFINMIMFGIEDDFDTNLDVVDIVCSVSKNVYNDRVSVSVQVDELMKTKTKTNL